MSLDIWAEEEIKLATVKESEYGKSCYESALKAYKTLLEDDHSGFSWGITRNILIRLMNSLPLSPITDEDFMVDKYKGNSDSKWLKDRGLKSDIQCPRMSSLFRYEYLNGMVKYTDVDRVEFIDENGFAWHGGQARSIVDEMFPITMPYYPTVHPYRVYGYSFIVDEKNRVRYEVGTFNFTYIECVVTPSGEKVEIDRLFIEDEGEVTNKRKKKKILKNCKPIIEYSIKLHKEI